MCFRTQITQQITCRTANGVGLDTDKEMMESKGQIWTLNYTQK